MSKEAMKLALERLQSRTDTADLDAIAALNEALAEQSAQTEAIKLAIEVFGGGDWHDELVDKDWADKANNAITVLRVALASQGEALAEQPAQQEQCCYGGIAHDCHAGVGCRIAERLTATSQPPAQPLTDEQMAKAWSVADGEHNASASVKRRITRAIEAALGITGSN